MLVIWGVALFSGTDPVSETIKSITGSEYSHVGLVLEETNSGQRYIFESTGSFDQLVWEHITPRVQVNRFESTVPCYSGSVSLRELRSPKKEDVKEYVQALVGTPYEKNAGELLRCLARDNLKEDPTSLFCSELVAKVLKDFGYLDGPRLANNYMPKDFSEKEYIHCDLGPEVVSKQNKKRKCCKVL